MKKLMFLLIITLAGTTLFGETIEEGRWSQTASTAGMGVDVSMTIVQETPHIISLDSDNGWQGYAWYVEDKELYAGFFELLRDESHEGRDDWTGEVFQFILEFDGLTLTIKAKSEEHAFQATFWKK